MPLKIFNSLKLEMVVENKELASIPKKDTEEKILTIREPEFDEKVITAPQILIERLYSLINSLRIYDYSYELNELPENGIYFFYEDGEKCEVSGKVMDRIVRIGTHKSDNRFRDRIKNHYCGNKNSSVFRKHVGSAIITKERIEGPSITEWMKHMTPTSAYIEKIIDNTFKVKFRFRCIPVHTKEDRLGLEENLIASLSCWNYPPSSQWLGHYAEKKEIRKSGLWNVQHTNSRNVMNEEHLNIIEKITSSIQSNNSTVIGELNTNQNQKIICFIPCCGSKCASGNIIKPEQCLSSHDLPNTWESLLEGRKEMQYCIKASFQKTSAINLYTGSPYSALYPYKNKIIELIHSQNLRLIIISAGYGIIDALEPINNYDEMMSGQVASHWRRTNLTDIIADFLLHEKPKCVYGFFAGETYWSTPGLKYRYFFTEGVKTALRNGLKLELAGCFYRVDGRGVKAILGSIGRTFTELMNTNFNDSYVNKVYEHGRLDGNVKIGFDKIVMKECPYPPAVIRHWALNEENKL